ncbi:EamA family transporter [Bacillus sp. FJAT-49705]|uniref:EamA family transporter n=1 Tax=Cytobacillus citreus TaxID=2833586 RepID=A0ABS5NQQ7_9BACI|nr:DMT family transporter [Cytobacillus citreus]MBS4190156.1 EamA family transporter [Cytobacillus citreus]
MRVYYFACISAVLLWSASFIATKIAYETFAPIQLGVVRTCLAVLIFWIINKIVKNKEKIRKEDRKRVAISSLFGITLYFTLENIGVSMTSASNAALIVASFPAITSLLEFFVFRSKPSFQKSLGIILAIIGVAILTQITISGSSKSFWGNLILIGGGIVWAFYNFITRDLTNKYSALTLTYYQMLIGAIWFIPFVFLEDKPWRIPSVTSMNALIFLCVGCSVAAFVLYNFGLKKLSASVSVSLMNLVPVLGLVFSVLILGEVVSLLQIIGGIIVIIGVILSSIQIEEVSNEPNSNSAT